MVCVLPDKMSLLLGLHYTILLAFTWYRGRALLIILQEIASITVSHLVRGWLNIVYPADSSTI